MTTRKEFQAWQTNLQARLTHHKSTRGVVATVKWLHNQGLSLPLAVLLILRLS